MAHPLILPSEIPWADIKGSSLEELLYWLFESMGAKELEWRIGGKGAGTSDQGRDLELVFFTPSPDGTLSKQVWWVEAKGRSGTVEPSAVRDAVLNAAGKADVEVLVVATNSNFSNPTRDWVKEWQRTNRRPVVKLWERTELENLCSKNPLAVVRLYSKALSPQGRLEVAKSRLWDYATFTDEPALERLWRERSSIEVDEQALFALAASELANGDLNSRAWAAIVPDNVLAAALCNGLINFFYLVLRASERGYRQEPIIRAISYLLLASLDRFGEEAVGNLLASVWDDVDGRSYTPEMRKIILEPVAGYLQSELKDVCAKKCSRVMTDLEILKDDELESYWQRLRITETSKEKSKRILTIEKTTDPCGVGLDLTQHDGCPLCNDKAPHEHIDAFIGIVGKVITYRKNGA
ncbi:restriction endonuclease [Methyloversatilis discipulorum]|uniref:restriction endonuclease n=1 Tax=Methyloversatilis discipulorum TaxID=1119528 RepID=UPI0009DBEA74|nr:restriction endonuclease [Methyloversatilis discipulorum]